MAKINYVGQSVYINRNLSWQTQQWLKEADCLYTVVAPHELHDDCYYAINENNYKIVISEYLLSKLLANKRISRFVYCGICGQYQVLRD